MIIRFLGTGTGLPSRERAPSGTLVRLRRPGTSSEEAFSPDGPCLLVDCGSGTIGRLAAAGIEPARLDYIYSTHAHGDHSADLVPFMQAMDLVGRTADLHWTAPGAMAEFLKGLLALQPWAAPKTYRWIHHPAESEPYCGDGWSVRAARTGHTSDSVGYRIDAGGRSVVISGDATNCPDLVALARGVDVLVLECSYPDQLAMAGHLTPASAGRMATEAGAGHLILTHFYPICRMEEIAVQANQAFAGRLTLAYDGLVIDI